MDKQLLSLRDLAVRATRLAENEQLGESDRDEGCNSSLWRDFLRLLARAYRARTGTSRISDQFIQRLDEFMIGEPGEAGGEMFWFQPRHMNREFGRRALNVLNSALAYNTFGTTIQRLSWALVKTEYNALSALVKSWGEIVSRIEFLEDVSGMMNWERRPQLITGPILFVAYEKGDRKVTTSHLDDSKINVNTNPSKMGYYFISPSILQLFGIQSDVAYKAEAIRDFLINSHRYVRGKVTISNIPGLLFTDQQPREIDMYDILAFRNATGISQQSITMMNGEGLMCVLEHIGVLADNYLSKTELSDVHALYALRKGCRIARLRTDAEQDELDKQKKTNEGGLV